MKSQKNAGFTLVETLLATALAVIVGALLVNILAKNTGQFYQERSIVSSSLDLNDVLQKLGSDIRETSLITSGYPEASPTYTGGANTLVLKLPSLSSSGTINNTYDYIVVTADSANILRRHVFADAQSNRKNSDEVLTTLLDTITFEYLDKNNLSVNPTQAVKIKVTLNLISKTGLISSKKSSSIIINLRNIP